MYIGLGTLYSYRCLTQIFFLIKIMKVMAWMCGYISADFGMYHLKQWFSCLKLSLPRSGLMVSLAKGVTCDNNRKAFSGCSMSVPDLCQIEFPFI